MLLPFPSPVTSRTRITKGRMPPGSPAPNVRRAMAAVGRQLNFRSTPIPHATKMRPSNRASLFVSPIIEELHREMKGPQSDSYTPRASDHQSNLPRMLHPVLKVDDASTQRTALETCEIRSKNIMGTSGKMTGAPQDGSISTAVQHSPNVNATIVQRVASAVDLGGRLRQSKGLLRAIREGGDIRKLFSPCVSEYPSNTMQTVELQAGIAAKLHHRFPNSRKMRLHGFRLFPSDFQLAEILPDGNVVTLTNPTLPHVMDMWRTKSVKEWKQFQYLYVVLYKENLSLTEAFRLLSEASDGLCSPEHFAVNVALEDTAVTVQLCSIRFPDPNGVLNETNRVKLVQKLLRVNLRPLRLRVQVVDWREAPCCPTTSWESRVQHSMLLRGISSTEINQLEGRILSKIAAFPNFFGSRHFGSPCTFRTYHVAAALQRDMLGEALVMAACLNYAEEPVVGRCWIDGLAELLRSGEDRPAVLKEWFHQNVPCRLKAQIAVSESSLVWNVLASCRICHMDANSMEGTPKVGDFVMPQDRCSSNDRQTAAKVELLPLDGCEDFGASVSPADIGGAFLNDGSVKHISTEEEAAPYTLHDIAIPYIVRNCDTLRKLSLRLGFRPNPQHQMRYPHGQPWYRPLFTSGSGYPHAARPWVKTLAEPSGLSTSASEETAYRLLTDLELHQGSSYTASSRGVPRNIWPIGKYGYRLTERLPAGVAPIAASNSAWHGIRCLAMHFTLPAYAYTMALLREFAVVEDCTEPLPLHTAARGGSGCSSSLGSLGEEVPMVVRRRRVLSTSSDGVVDGDLMSLRRTTRPANNHSEVMECAYAAEVL
uniref:Uncharacterized protein n=1 Tax=Trypanosoma congolense (strain IL3000) TaxID=1068625 RepID=G0UY02_TRYCI|nr:conserved hypothetical protein [Trypanosoma congolense IL3000]